MDRFFRGSKPFLKSTFKNFEQAISFAVSLEIPTNTGQSDAYARESPGDAKNLIKKKDCLIIDGTLIHIFLTQQRILYLCRYGWAFIRRFKNVSKVPYEKPITF